MSRNIDETTEIRTQEMPAVALAAHSPSQGLARFVVLSGPQVGRRFTFRREVVLGRGADAGVLLDDAQVSRHHARVSSDERGFLIEDLSSRNGTTLNGRAVHSERLAYGDRVQIGGTLLLFTHVDPIEDRLGERQKLESIGRLGSGIAHDINNLLGAVMAGAEHALDVLQTRGGTASSVEEVRECLDEVVAAARRGAELTQRLLSFARRVPGEHKTVDLSGLADEAIELARRTFDRSIRLERDVRPRVCVAGDRGQLHQLIMNLLINARDAMPDGGTLSLRLRLGDARAPADPPRDEGRRVAVLEVVDTGVGMDPQTRALMFEPFFTTKGNDRGSGLGLATALDVVTSHGGTIDCDTAPGRGTHFRVVLPAVDDAEPLPRMGAGTLEMKREVASAATILLVDDDAAVRRATLRLLQRDGHTVIEAIDGRQAIQTYEARRERVDLVIMDLDMPEVDGESAQLALRALDPGVRIVFVSGYCDDTRRRTLEAHGAFAVLQKPCDASTLRGTVADALRRRAR